MKKEVILRLEKNNRLIIAGELKRTTKMKPASRHFSGG